MKINAYETDRFFYYLDVNDEYGFQTMQGFEDMLTEIPDDLVKEYSEALEKWETVNRKIRNIVETKK
jgi:hypothetical protein